MNDYVLYKSMDYDLFKSLVVDSYAGIPFQFWKAKGAVTTYLDGKYNSISIYLDVSKFEMIYGYFYYYPETVENRLPILNWEPMVDEDRLYNLYIEDSHDNIMFHEWKVRHAKANSN